MRSRRTLVLRAVCYAACGCAVFIAWTSTGHAARAAEEDAPTITIDMSAAEAPMRRAGSGLLLPFVGMEKPRLKQMDELYKPLKIRLIRTRMAEVPAVVQRDPHVKIMVVLSDSWGYPSRDPSHPAAQPWKSMEKWDALVADSVAKLKQLHVTPIYDIWNEPNMYSFFGDWSGKGRGKWPDADFDKYCEFYKHTYQLLRKLHPEAEITGPSLGITEPAGWESMAPFKNFCVKNQCVPDYWNWHYGGENAMEQVREVLGWKLNKGMIYAEFLGPEQSRRPGRAAWEMALVEKAGAFGVAKSSWVRFGADHGSMGDTVFEDQDGVWKKRGMWWVFATLAEMEGTRVASKATTPRVNALASLSPEKHELTALLGNSRFEKDEETYNAKIKSGYRGPVKLVIAGAESLGGEASVTLERIPWDWPKHEVASPETIVEKKLPVTRGRITLEFDWPSANDAYRLYVSPAKAQ